MDKQYLEDAISRNLTIRQIASEKNTSFTNTRYWLKKHGLKTSSRKNKGIGNRPIFRSCACGETNPSNFYGNKHGQCKKCDNQYVIEKGRKNRVKAIKYLGSKCLVCGFDDYIASMQFHHLNPKEKDVAFRSHRCWSWKRLQKELDKCILLCSNCHAAVHSGELVLPS